MRSFGEFYNRSHNCEYHEAVSKEAYGRRYFVNWCKKNDAPCASLFGCSKFEEKKPKAPEKMYSDKIAEDLKKLSAIGAKEIAADMERLARERTLLLKYMEKKCETCAANYMAGMEDCMGCVNCSNWEWNGK